ncbi:hypothetical protein AAFF_G00310020 [Aldrovandia affinis]|uniref:Uncharacterized protein n=1 Tax=Aldrovandia affinis TaxID=143900 RepID=A0AAD7SP27_9TELE|nr:hypothetical protein AAFF_G00310020 [Aldrovandia affinis]
MSPMPENGKGQPKAKKKGKSDQPFLSAETPDVSGRFFSRRGLQVAVHRHRARGRRFVRCVTLADCGRQIDRRGSLVYDEARKTRSAESLPPWATLAPIMRHEEPSAANTNRCINRALACALLLNPLLCFILPFPLCSV